MESHPITHPTGQFFMERASDALSGHRILGSNDAEEEEYLIRKIRDSPQPKWKGLANRRLQIWGGDITAKGVLVAQPLPPFINKFPDIMSRIENTGAFENSPHRAPNHVILNEYLPGQGIMPHEDGPRYHPVVATLSLGSHTLFHYYQYQKESENEAISESTGHGKTINMTPILSILLEPRSLIISSSSMYTSYLHGIDDKETDLIAPDEKSAGTQIANFTSLQDEAFKSAILEGTPLQRSARYSLTCRDVARVYSVNAYPHR